MLFGIHQRRTGDAAGLVDLAGHRLEAGFQRLRFGGRETAMDGGGKR
jgi:hypothetical protein